MSPLSLRENKKSKGERKEAARRIWSPSQEIIVSPCTKFLGERESKLRAQSLLSRFMQIQLQEPSPREAEISRNKENLGSEE